MTSRSIPAQAVRKSVTVNAAQARAFEVFTAQFASWWPLATHKIGKVPAQAGYIEPRAGGRLYEVGIDGTECDWGRVLVWDPPSRVVLGWQLNSEFKYDPAVESEVEVHFTALDAESTRVDLEHRKLEVFGEKAAAMFGMFDSPGWGAILHGFSEFIGQAAE